MGMFVTALGVCTARIWARMVDRVVWKPLRQHRRSWQFVSELFNIILDRLTDSSGDGVTLDNVYDKSYMNSFFEAAETATVEDARADPNGDRPNRAHEVLPLRLGQQVTSASERTDQ